MAPKTTVELLGRAWQARLRERVSQTRRLCFVCAPFMTLEGCDLFRANFSERFRRRGEIRILSDLSPTHLLQASTDPAAVRLLLNSVENGALTHLPRLHAKVYIFDGDYAVVTSGNLTAGGLYRNFEYGVGTGDRALVRRIHDDVQAYSELGAAIDPQQLSHYCELAEEVRRRFADQLRSVTKKASAELRKSLRQAEDELLRIRGQGGRVTPLFGRTIQFLLERHGPLSTRELHPLIQELHPDLCDDSVDRVIDGVHYGKKWKHWVRSAQQRLKDEKAILLDGGKWKLQ